MFQARRPLTESAGRPQESLLVGGVALEAATVGSSSGKPQPAASPLATTDFPALVAAHRARHAVAAEVEMTVAFLFAGPCGRLSGAQVAGCDHVVTVLPVSGEGAAAATAGEGDDEESAPVNVSALMAITLHQFSISTNGAASATTAAEKFGTLAAQPRGTRAATANN